MGKPVFGVSDQVYTNRAVQPQKMTRGLKFRIYVEEGLYYPYSENKALISCAVTAQLICVFVFAYAKSRVSNNEAHLTESHRENCNVLIYRWYTSVIVRLSLLRKTILIPEYLAFMCVCVFVDGCISQF